MFGFQGLQELAENARQFFEKQQKKKEKKTRTKKKTMREITAEIVKEAGISLF